jgi:hypothetical protein
MIWVAYRSFSKISGGILVIFDYLGGRLDIFNKNRQMSEMPPKLSKMTRMPRHPKYKMTQMPRIFCRFLVATSLIYIVNYSVLA